MEKETESSTISIEDIWKLINVVSFNKNHGTKCKCWRDFQKDTKEEFERKIKYLVEIILQEEEILGKIITEKGSFIGFEAAEEFKRIKRWIMEKARTFGIYKRHITPWYQEEGLTVFTCCCEELEYTLKPVVDPDDY